MKTLIRHLRHQHSTPITVALMVNKHQQVLARGIAICSSKDNFNKKIGRAIAVGRANKALIQHKDCENNLIQRARFRQLFGTFAGLKEIYGNKCSYQPTISIQEREWVRDNYHG